MKLKAFSIYDTKSLAYGVPFFMSSVGQATRAFADLSNDNQSIIYKHPTDFVLFEIGDFDDSDGRLECIQPFRSLGLGSDFKENRVRNLVPSLMEGANVVNGKEGEEVVR